MSYLSRSILYHIGLAHLSTIPNLFNCGRILICSTYLSPCMATFSFPLRFLSYLLLIFLFRFQCLPVISITCYIKSPPIKSTSFQFLAYPCLYVWCRLFSYPHRIISSTGQLWSIQFRISYILFYPSSIDPFPTLSDSRQIFAFPVLVNSSTFIKCPFPVRYTAFFTFPFQFYLLVTICIMATFSTMEYIVLFVTCNIYSLSHGFES